MQYGGDPKICLEYFMQQNGFTHDCMKPAALQPLSTCRYQKILRMAAI